MPEVRLTEKRILDLPVPSADYIRYWDKEINGLGVKVMASGRKVYIFKDRLNRKPVWAKSLPRCSDTTLAEMRDSALEWKSQIRRGIDPWKPEEQPSAQAALTLYELCLENLEVISSRKLKPVSQRHLRDCRLATTRVENSAIGIKPITEISVKDAEVFLSQFPGRSAEHLRNWLRNCYNLAISRSYVDLGFNPWKYCERKYALPEAETLPRCSDTEIAQIADYLRQAEKGLLSDSIDPAWVTIVWFLIRTGSRPLDSRKIEKNWLVRRAGSWVIEHPRTKTGKQVMVLAASHGQQLSQMPSRLGNKYLFQGRGTSALSERKFYFEFNHMRKSIGLEKSPYAIRRWFAKTGRQVFDGDIEPVQQLCGWETKDIAERYAGDDEALVNSMIMENASICGAINSRIDEVVG